MYSSENAIMSIKSLIIDEDKYSDTVTILTSEDSATRQIKRAVRIRYIVGNLLCPPLVVVVISYALMAVSCYFGLPPR